MRYLKRLENIKTIQYKDMTDWGNTEPQKTKKPFSKKYFNLVFADFIDDGAVIGTDSDKVSNYWEISIKEPEIENSRDINSKIESINDLKEFYLEIKSCIDRIKDEYRNVLIYFNVEESGENNAWVNTIERNINIIFTYK